MYLTFLEYYNLPKTYKDGISLETILWNQWAFTVLESVLLYFYLQKIPQEEGNV